MLLKNKVAIVTGGASGLGKAIVEAYLKEGANVVATDIDKVKLEILSKENIANERLQVVKSDVSIRNDNIRLIENISERYGKIDILVNNAGISDRLLPVAEISDEEWDRVIDINLSGPFSLCRWTIQKMLEQSEKGCIINIASAAGIGGGRAGAAYVASKFGLVGLTKNIAYMYGPEGIRCNAICPGYVETGIDHTALTYNVSKFGAERIMKGTQSIRVGIPKEIADIAVFLASSYANLINGETILADAGKGAY